jgi:diguanylate cyclase (GGDEF)-like protein/PAS domain S-box-containing protein
MSRSSIRPSAGAAPEQESPAPAGFERLFASLRARITLIAITVLVAVLWAAELVASHFLRADVERMLAAQQYSAASFVAADIDRGLRERQRALQAVAQRLAEPLRLRPAGVQGMLEDRVALRGMFNWGLLVVDADGVAIASVPDELGRTGADYGGIEEIRAALADGKARIGNPLLGRSTGKPVLPIISPILERNGRVLGALVGVTNLALPSFLDEIGAQRYGQSGGYLLVAPKAGVFVAATDASRIMQPVPEPGVNAIYDRFVAGYEGSGVAVSSRGVEELSSAHGVPSAGWFVAAVLPTVEAFAPIHEMQQRLIAVAAALTLLSALISWLVLSHELAPLGVIARRLRAMSRGETPREPLPLAASDEIGEVAASINALIVSIAAAEGALRESEERFRELADAAPVLIWMSGLDKRCDYFNRVWLEFTGRSFAEEFGDGWAEGVHPDDLQRCFSTYVDSFDARRRFTMEYRLRYHDGSYRWLLDNGAPRFDGAGNFVGYIGSCVDIDALKHAEHDLRESDSLNRSILDSFSECVCVVDPNGIVVRVNDAWKRLAELPALVGGDASRFADSVGREYFALCPNGLLCASDGESDAVAAIADVLSGRSPSARLEYVCAGSVRQVGVAEARWFELRVRRLEDREGAVIAHEDITRIKHADELQIAAAAFHIQEGIVITDAGTRIIRVNPAFTRLTGYSSAEVVGSTPALLKSGYHDDDFYRAMYESLANSGFWQGEIWNRHKSGDIFPEWMTITAVYAPNGAISHYVGAFSDISERKKAEAHIRVLAFYDSLTGLPNRRLLYDRLAQAIVASVRSAGQGALMFLDLDHFKMLNDTRGHEIGDQLLIEVARRLEAGVREGDTVARLGGDEFVVMLENLHADYPIAALQAGDVAEKLLATIAQPFMLRSPVAVTAVTAGGEQVEGDAASSVAEIYHCTCSIGVALFQGHSASVDDLLRHADVAMYQAKADSRNAVRFFDPQMQSALDTRTQLEAGLRRAIADGQLLLHYQLQVDASGRAIGVEALARWQHPERGLVSPAEFIPLAEETGLIVPLGEWALREACRQLVVWAADPPMRSLCLSVNVSRRQFRQSDFVDVVRRALADSGANPSRLKLELTESLVLDDAEGTAARMRELGALGVGFSLDDFGIGYSSLSCLRQLPLDQLKIDQSFVRGLGTDDDSAAIVRTVIALGREMGLEVIAEGVENEVQHRLLIEFGCAAFQGYLFGRPQSAASLSEALQT